MHETIVIRRYRSADHAAIRTLHDRTTPAGQTATTAHPSPPDLENIAATYQAFWVAVDTADPAEPVVGMVGVRPPGDEVPAAGLCGRQDIVQLKRMRVAPERQRRGIGRRLLATAVAWARNQGYHAIVLDTTVEQAAAVALYRSTGFRPVGRSTLGVYTLLWFELPLRPADRDT